jgi:hypothetical protein
MPFSFLIAARVLKRPSSVRLSSIADILNENPMDKRSRNAFVSHVLGISPQL